MEAFGPFVDCGYRSCDLVPGEAGAWLAYSIQRVSFRVLGELQRVKTALYKLEISQRLMFCRTLDITYLVHDHPRLANDPFLVARLFQDRVTVDEARLCHHKLHLGHSREAPEHAGQKSDDLDRLG